MRSHGRHSTAGALLAAATLALGCGPGDGVPLGQEHAYLQWPVAWERAGGALVVVHEEGVAEVDHFVTRCPDSGIYAVDETGIPALRFNLSPEICSLGPNPGTFAGGTGGQVWVAAEGGLASVDLKDGEVDLVAVSPPTVWRYPSESSGSGREISFVGSEERAADGGAEQCLYVVQANGQGVRRVTCFLGRRIESRPSWAPDSRYLVTAVASRAALPNSGAATLVTVDVATGETVELGWGQNPVWSPDGMWIAYVSITHPQVTEQGEAASGPESTIRLMRTTGEDDHEIALPAEFSRVEGQSSSEQGFAGVAPWAPLVWSPNSERIAFSRIEGNGSSVWVVRIDGTGLVRLPVPPPEAIAPPGEVGVP